MAILFFMAFAAGPMTCEQRRVRELDEYITELYGRLLRADGDEFEQIARELRVATQLMESTKDGSRNSREAKGKRHNGSAKDSGNTVP